MKENLIYYRTCACNINYHMVWSVKYRRKILNPEIEEYLKELVQQIAEDKGFIVHLFECGEGDHRQKTVRTFSGNKKPAMEGRAVEPFLLCGNNRICI